MTHSTPLNQNLKFFKVVRKGVSQSLRQIGVDDPPLFAGGVLGLLEFFSVRTTLSFLFLFLS